MSDTERTRTAPETSGVSVPETAEYQLWTVSEGEFLGRTRTVAAYPDREDALAHAESIDPPARVWCPDGVERYTFDDGAVVIDHEPSYVVAVDPVPVRETFDDTEVERR